MPINNTEMSAPKPDVYSRPVGGDKCASFWRRFIWYVQMLAWEGIYWWPTKALGAERASNALGWLAARPGPGLPRHRIVMNNLRLAFPDKRADERYALARAAWENIGRTIGELPHLSSLSAGDARIVLSGAEHLETIAASGQGAVFVSGHLANWEIMSLVICRRFADCLMVYRALNNPHIDKRLARLRRDYGMCQMAPKGGLATRALMRTLAAGKPVALFNDQKYNEGLAVAFFGQAAMTAPGPAHLALKYAVPIVPVATHRIGPMRFAVRIHAPYRPPATGDMAHDIRTCVAGISAFIEREICAHPAQWLWQHRRWPEQAASPRPPHHP